MMFRILLVASALTAAVFGAAPAASAVLITPVGGGSTCTTKTTSAWTGRVEWRTVTRTCDDHRFVRYTCHKVYRITPNGKVRLVEDTCANVLVPR
jgi:hypothetical protein